MKISFVLQIKDLCIMLLVGILLGIFYGLINITNNIHENIFTRIICDIIFMITATISYIIIVEKINFGTLRGYLFIGFLLGFKIERITLGKIFAKGLKYVYNKICKFNAKLKETKMGKIIFK